MREGLQKKVDRAIKLIRGASKIAAANSCPEIEVAYSSGKDSDVILELVKMSGVPYRAIYKNTTIDNCGAISHAKEMGAEMVRPKLSFFKLIEKHGLPNKLRRFCCGYLKEYKVLDYAIVGVRREESVRRAKRYIEPEQCRVYSKTEKVRQYFPILDWTSQDVAEFISERGIRCHPLYYDEQGRFHPERRVGCIGCVMLEAVSMYADEYEHLVRDFFYWRKTQKEWEEIKRTEFLGVGGISVGLFDTEKKTCKEFLEDYFKIKF